MITINSTCEKLTNKETYSYLHFKIVFIGIVVQSTISTYIISFANEWGAFSYYFIFSRFKWLIWFVFRPRMSGRPDRYRDKQSLDERGAVWRSSFRRTRFILRSNRSVSNAVDDISSSWGRRSQVSPQSLCKQRKRSAQRSGQSQLLL